MNVKSRLILKILLLCTLIVISLATNAQRGGRRFEGGRRWHGGDIRRFEIRDRVVWGGGHWRHVRYSGRLGWWWVVGPSWYFYSQPIYPYPDPYTPPVVVVQSSQPQSSTQPPPPVQNWYFCEASKQYYPYVTTCPAGWKVVPATPASGSSSTPAK